MDAIAVSCNIHAALRDLYREALRKWAAVRAVNPPDFIAIQKAANERQDIEHKLTQHRNEHYGCGNRAGK